MTALAAAVLDDVAPSAGRHPGSKSVLLGPFSNVWLIRALHLISNDHWAKGGAYTCDQPGPNVLSELGRTRISRGEELSNTSHNRNAFNRHRASGARFDIAYHPRESH